MSPIEIALTCGFIALASGSDEPGVIRGRVVNMSQGETPSPQAEVILRARVDGEFVAVSQAVTDGNGNYRFEGLPVGSDYLYLPGASRAGVHYPGRRVGLTRGQPTAFVTLEVRDAVAAPSPLVIRQHEIAIGTERDAVHVSEALLVDNPTTATFVGRAAGEGTLPVTLQLHIPGDFERVTFEKERFGSQFRIIDGRLVTGIPWTPGRQWLKFTYALRAEAIRGVWRRVMDAPCESLCIRVRQGAGDEITCDLPPAPAGLPGEKVFQSSAGVLSAGREIRVGLGGVAWSWPVYARGFTLLLLLGLIAGAVRATRRKGRRETNLAADSAAEAPLSPATRTAKVKRRRLSHHRRAA